MSWFNRRRKGRPEAIQVPRIRFLGEQDGIPERDLKKQLVDLFRRDQSIAKAYLARISYGGDSLAVALCLCSRSDADHGLAEKVGRVFASMFGGDQYLDIVFLTEAQESELIAVCRPFFAANGAG